MTNSPIANVQLLNYHLPAPFVGFSTERQIGYSEGPYRAFNINDHCGDTSAHIAANRRLLCDKLHIREDRLILPHQLHTTNSLNIDASFLELSNEERTSCLEGIDILMTNLQGVCIGVFTADCVPILVVDPKNKAICAIHAGWRGTIGNIASKAIRQMSQNFRSNPSELIAIIGPSISVMHYEVGDEVVRAFVDAGFNSAVIKTTYDSIEHCKHQYIDLWAANTETMLDSGLDLTNIHISGICNFERANTFFSVRRDGISTGRIFNGLLIRPE